MGKKMDALLGRKFKVSKFKATVNLANSRLSILKNQRNARLSIARSDLVQLLNQGLHERALLRIDQVIKEQNMLDVFEMIDGYCLLLLERVNLIEQEKVCPDELNEAASSLIYASTRCGEFPELQEIRAVLASRFGKEFAARAIELRNNCGVNTKMITKLSTRQSGLETRLKMLKEIASENGIVLQIEDISPTNEVSQEKENVEQKQNKPQSEGRQNQGETKIEADNSIFTKEMEEVVSFSELKRVRKYRDAAEAAQAAFESAAYAAAAARAAVELSRSESFDPEDQDGDKNVRSKRQSERKEQTEVKELSGQLRYEKIHPKNDDIETDDEVIDVGNKNGARITRSISVSSSDSDSDGNIIEGTLQSSDVEDHFKTLEKDLVFDRSDDEKYEHPEFKTPTNHANRLNPNGVLFLNEVSSSEKFNNINDEGMFGGRVKIPSASQKPISVRTRLFGRQ